ncbi:MAG: PAS domain S-box protein [Candidatus Cyclobacteriaceae bacterium M3_2C_046]
MLKPLHINQTQALSLWDISLDLLIDLDIKGFIIGCQPKDESFLGYQEKELLGLHITQIIQQKYHKQIKDYLKARCSDCNALDLNGSALDKNGQEVPLNINISMYSHHGVQQYMAILNKTSALKEQKLSLDEKLEFYDLISDKFSDTIILLLKNNNIVYVSESVKNVLGYDPEEASKFNLLKHFHPEDLYQIRRRKDQKDLTHNEKQVFRYRHKEGHYIWIETRIKQKMSHQDENTKSVIIIRDVTDRIKYEQELIEAKKMAEQAVNSKNTTLSELTHEIRTPMNAILGMSHLLLERSPRKDQKELINTLKYSAENLLHMMNDILDYSKIEADKIEFESVPFNLDLLLRSLKLSFKSAAEIKDLKFSVSKSGDVPSHLIGDSVRLNQILNNLLSNAIKFTHSGRVNLVVSSQKLSKEKYLFKFNVSDTGIGIPVHKIDQIFEPYQQGKPEITRKYGGTGLGLSILKKLVELQGGSIQVESSENKGSNFTVLLEFPLASQEEVSPATSNIEVKDLNDVIVLYIEDVDSNRYLMHEYCAGWNVKVESANTGKKALEMIDGMDYDLVLLDLQLPDFNGLDLYKKIRKFSTYYQTVPVIAITADNSQKIKNKVAKMGLNDFLTKPLYPNELYHKLNKHIQVRKPKKAGTSPKNSPNQFSLNFDLLDSLYQKKPKDYIILLDLMIIEYKKYYQALDYSVRDRDLKGFRKIVHKITSNITSLGMEPLLKFLEEVKLKMRNQLSSEQQEEILQDLNFYFDRLAKHFKEKRNQLQKDTK